MSAKLAAGAPNYEVDSESDDAIAGRACARPEAPADGGSERGRGGDDGGLLEGDVSAELGLDDGNEQVDRGANKLNAFAFGVGDYV